MNKKTIIILIVLAVGVVILNNAVFTQPQTLNTTVENRERIGTVLVSIENVISNETVELVEGDTALSVLQKMSEESDFTLETETYTGLGMLVKTIGNNQNGDDDKYWQYSVNETMPQVGADSLVLSPDDTVLWEFKESEF